MLVLSSNSPFRGSSLVLQALVFDSSGFQRLPSAIAISIVLYILCNGWTLLVSSSR